MGKFRDSSWLPWALAGGLAVVMAVLVVPSFLNSYGPWAESGKSDGEGDAYAPVTPQDGSDDNVSKLEQRLKDRPNDLVAHLNLAAAYLQRVRETGDPTLYVQAERVLDDAYKLSPGNPETLAAQAVLALGRHDFSHALRLAQEALASAPDNARYYGLVADAQLELGQYEEAVGSLQEMVNRRPDFNSYSRVAYARELFGDPEGAQLAMLAAVDAGSSTPENMAWAFVQLGNLSLTLGNLDEADGYYRRSLDAFPNYAFGLAGQARVASSRGDNQQAAALYERAFERMPLAEFAIALGDVYSRMGDTKKASAQTKLVRAIDKLYAENGVNTDLELALFLADHDIELPTSVEKARASYEARPTIHAADVLAWTLYKSGRSAEAEKYSEESLKLGTRDGVKLYHAAVIARENGKRDVAQEYLRQALTFGPQFSLLYGDHAVAMLEELQKSAVSATSGEGRR